MSNSVTTESSLGDYVQYGCGLSAPDDWQNFDASPTLRLQRVPVVGGLIGRTLDVQFPDNVLFGDIVSGLPIPDSSCQGVYCSHVLEHLAFKEFEDALANTYRILKPGGTFRLVMPDLHSMVTRYLGQLESGADDASITFMQSSGLGLNRRPRGPRAALSAIVGNSRHQWLWDEKSTNTALLAAGFREPRRCEFGDSTDKRFQSVEDLDRFTRSIAFEATK